MMMNRAGILASRTLNLAPKDLTKFRYVRFKNNPNRNYDEIGSYASIAQIEIYEKIGGPNVAPLATATASETDSAATPAGNVNTGTATTARWRSAQNGRQRACTLTLDFGASPRYVSQIVFTGRILAAGDDPNLMREVPNAFLFEGSVDGQSWKTITDLPAEGLWTSGEKRNYYDDSLCTFIRLEMGIVQDPNDFQANFKSLATLIPRLNGVDLRPKLLQIYADNIYGYQFIERNVLDNDPGSVWLSRFGGGTSIDRMTFSFLTKDADHITSFQVQARPSFPSSTPVSFRTMMATGKRGDSDFKNVPLGYFSNYPPFTSSEIREFTIGQGT